MTDDIEFKIARLDLQDRDILVVKLANHVPRTTLDHFREMLKSVVGGRKCMILEKGVDLQVLSVAEIERRAAGEKA